MEIDNTSNIKRERQIVIEELINEKKEVLEDINKTCEQINELEKNSAVQEYLKLKKSIKELNRREENIQSDIDIEEILNCDHIFANEKLNVLSEPKNGMIVKTLCSSDLRCIKCGLHINWLRGDLYEKHYANSQVREIRMKAMKSKIAHEYFRQNKLRSFNPTSYLSVELALAIYARIIECNPGIDEVTAKVYFEHAMRNILKDNIPNEKHKDRVRRLDMYEYTDRYKN